MICYVIVPYIWVNININLSCANGVINYVNVILIYANLITRYVNVITMYAG